MNTIIKKHIIHFFIGIGLATTAMFPGLLDYISIPRLSFLVLTVSIVSIIVLQKSSKKLSIEFPDILFFIFLLWASLGIRKSHDIAESLVSLLKYISLFILFKIAQFFVKNEAYSFTQKFAITLLVINSIGIVLLLWGILQMPHCPSFEDVYKVYGLHGHKNVSVSYLAITIPFMLLFAVQQQKTLRYITLIITLCCIALLFFIESRAAFASILSMICIGILFYWKRLFTHKLQWKQIGLYIVVTIIVAISFKYLIFCGTIFPEHDTKATEKFASYYYDKSQGSQVIITSSSYERMELWKKTISMISDNSIVGVGLDNWKLEYPKYTLNRLYRCEAENINFVSPHNDFLWIASETGIIGLLLYLTFIFVVCWKSIKNFSYNEWYVNAALLSIVGGCTNALFDFPHQTVAHMIILYISLGILSSTQKGVSLISKNYVILLVTLFFVCASFILAMRMQGEYYSNKISVDYEKSTKNIKIFCENAESSVYTTNAYAMPISWYYGNALAQEGDFHGAMKQFTKAIAISPYNRYVLQDLATAYYKLNNYEKSITFFKKALKISPKYDEARMNYVILLIKKKQFDIAKKEMQSIANKTDKRYLQIKEFLQNK